MAASGGPRRRRVPQISVHPTGMYQTHAPRRISSSSGGGGGGGGGGGNALVSFAPNGCSPSLSQLSDIEFQRGYSDWTQGPAGAESRATTAPSANASVLRSRVSPNFRQALQEAQERMAARRSVAHSVREQRKSNTNHPDSISRLPEEDSLVEEDDSFDADDVFNEAAGAAGGAASAAIIEPPPHASAVTDPRRRRALRRWGLMREIINDIHRERHAKKAEGWSMFFKHVRAMSEAEKTRQDLYERYNIFGNGKSDFMASLPVIPDELLLAAGIPLPTSKARSRAMGLGAPRARGGGAPKR